MKELEKFIKYKDVAPETKTYIIYTFIFLQVWKLESKEN